MGLVLFNALSVQAQTPVAYYPFSGNASDAVGSNHGTVNGATLTTDRFGNANSAYSFDGVNDYINFNQPWTTVTDNFTISVWIKPNTLGGSILSNGQNAYPAASPYNGYAMKFGARPVGDMNGVAAFNGGVDVISTGAWFQIVFVRESGVAKLYVNGIVQPNTITNAPNTPAVSAIIGALNNGIDFVNGTIDEVKIYNTALTASQILAEYNSSAPANTLIAHYQFNNNAADSSGNNLHGTILGAPTFTTDRHGNANSAIAFDGNVANRIEVDDNLLLHTPSITLSAWVKLNSLGGIKTFVDKPMGTSFTDSWHFGTENSNFSSWHFDAPTLNPYSQVTSPAGTGQWYYVVSTFDNASKQHKLYVDGVLRTTNTFNSTIGYDASKMYIGAAIENGSLAFPMDGAIDEVKIYGGAMSASEIASDYENAVVIPLPGSGNALSFDGINDYTEVPNNSNFNFAVNDNFTVQFWLKVPSANQPSTSTIDNMLIEKWSTVNPNGYPFVMRYFNHTHPTSPGQIVFSRYNGSTGASVLSGKTLNDDQWHQITCAKNGTQLLFYIDGILTGTATDLTTGTTSNTDNLYFGCRGGNFGFFSGSLDEVRIWNTALTESQIRDRMCQKINSSDPLFSNLVASYNFDESTGNTAFDGSVNSNNGTLVNGPTRVTSGAAIGNTSAHSYAGASSTINLAHPTRGDDLTVTLTSGAASGIQVYNVNEEPNTRTGVSGLASNNSYFGTFVSGGTAPSFTAVYNYDGIPGITNETGLVLFSRNGNDATSWAGEGASVNTNANTLTKNSIASSQKEFIVGENDPGVISSNQSSCFAFVPNPLTGTAAFNGVVGVTYQWQESNNNVTFTDISGATSLTYQPGLITSDKYFRRKATNANNEVAFSNVVFIDIIGLTFYADVDGDGYGDPNNTTIACSLPPGYLTDNTDCNDADPLQRPGQVWYTDMDNDGYVSSNGPGQPALTITQCSRPSGGKLAAELVTTVGRDCDDNDPTINPLAQRLTISSDPDFANGVYPLQGDPSTTFFFEAMYFDDNNALPSVTFPRAYLDFESNNLINEPQDRIVVMTEFDASDQNTVDGKKYVGSISGLPNGNTWQTYLISEYSNTCQRGTGPFPHPDVLLQPNVQIFANYIGFSDENPPVSSPLSITAYVGNPSDFAVQNVVVRMRNQTEPNTVYPDVTIPYIAAHTSGVATWNITTPSFTGICPIQVTVDYTNNIPESNELDNVAVSFFNNGNAPVNGEIIVEAGVYPSTSYATANNTLYLKFNSYFNGTNLPPELKVAGALVTFQIDETGATFTGFTGLGGDISIPFTAPVSPGVYHISGTVSSPPFTGYINPNITNFELIYGNDPDYTVELSASSTTCLAGQSITHTIVVTNDGLAASIVGSHLTLSVPGGNPSLITFDVPPLAIGESYTIDNVNILVPTAGTYTACAQADVLQEVIELNETNNNSCINIIAAIAVPDLEVIQGSSGPHSICNPVDLFAMIRNAGGVSCAAFSSRMVVKLGNTIIQTFDHSVPALGPSEAYSYTKTFIPAVPGTYTYSVEGDFSHVVTEYDENNNINSFSIEVTPCLPELAAEYCDLTAISANDYTSGNMTLSATINNTGELDVAAAVLVRFQFSNNTFVDATHLGGIPKGQSVTVTTARPAFVNPGVTMKVIVDPNNTIAELYETNNESWQKPTAWALAFTNSVEGCGPDLNDYNYKPFYAYYLPVKIVNLGLYNADTVKVKYEISGPGLIGTVHLATVNAFDIFTDCDYCPQGVSLPSPFVFPQAGIYTLTLTIDPGNVYNEVDEGNNVWVIPIEVNNKPDMRVLSDYINPTLLNPAKGQPVTISVTYDNVGFSNVADQMKMKLFVDNVAIDSVSGLSGLASGNYTTVNFTVPWSSTVPGTHVIKAFIDSDNGILENDETNNIATRAITVGTSANLWVKSLSVLNYYPDLNDNITIKTKIENQGDLPTNALVSVFYVNNSLDSVLIAAHQVSLPGNDSISLNIPWVVADNKTKIVVVVSNSTALEYNYGDNSAFIELGKMALFTEAFPACETGDKGTMTAYINGGEPPYSYSWSNGAATKSILAAADTYSVTVFDATGQQVSGSGVIPPCAGILVKAKCYLEGFYIAPGIMSSALTQSGIVSPLEYTDTITVRLHAPTAGFPLVASCKTILHNNGTVTCEFPAGVSGSSRYIVLEHRNSIETWSAAPVLISNGMMYDFSNAANKAYGNNLLLMLGGTYAIYGGDVNQDGTIDIGDMTPVDNDASSFASGYLNSDVNGDGTVDISDMTIIDNNGAAFVTAVTP